MNTKNIYNSKNFADKFNSALYFLSAFLIIVLFAAICVTLTVFSLQSIKTFGLSFLTASLWDPVAGKFGALTYIYGTVLTSTLALLLSIPFAFSVIVFLGEYYTEGILSNILKSAVELLAGIPSVIYGFWALYALVPIIRKFEMAFEIPPYGVGILTAAIVLAIMIIPYSASIGREAIQLVPSELKESAYALGATQYEVLRYVTVPYARSGIFAGILLSLGRAVGETMAVTMVIGNVNKISLNIFAPGNTMASVIANQFSEACDKLYISSLVEIGLVLFVITGVINVIGKYILKKISI